MVEEEKKIKSESDKDQAEWEMMRKKVCFDNFSL